MRRIPALAICGLLVAAGLAGCSKPTVNAGTCLDGLARSTSPASRDAGARVRIACFDGSGTVQLAQLGTPAVVNLWAGWCEPCRAELPEVEKFAQAAAGKVAVIGVDSSDTKTSGSSLIADAKLTYPMLFDPSLALGHAVGQNHLPVTLFVRPGGEIAHTYLSTTPLNSRKIAELSERYLGVQVNL